MFHLLVLNSFVYVWLTCNKMHILTKNVVFWHVYTSEVITTIEIMNLIVYKKLRDFSHPLWGIPRQSLTNKLSVTIEPLHIQNFICMESFRMHFYLVSFTQHNICRFIYVIISIDSSFLCYWVVVYCMNIIINFPIYLLLNIWMSSFWLF